MDIQLSWIRALLAEPMRDAKKHPRNFRPEDFAVIASTKDTIEKNRSGGQSSMEMRDYVVNVLHPLFKKRAQIEKAEKERLAGRKEAA